MKSKDNPLIRKMLKMSLVITTVLLIASLLLICYEFSLLQKIKDRIPGLEQYKNPAELQFYLHVSLSIFTIISVILTYKFTEKFRRTGIALSAVGTFSLMCFMANSMIFYEYYDEYYLHGWESDDSRIFVIVTGAISLSFYLFCFFTIARIFVTINKSQTSLYIDSNEYAFEITQYIGIVCGFAQLFLVLFIFQYLWRYRYHLTPDYINWVYMAILTFSIPYLFMIIYWIARLISKKGKSPYDEKQLHDLYKSGLLTWLISIPLMSAFMFIGQGKFGSISGLIVFPFYVAVTLLIFSTISLINFKRI